MGLLPSKGANMKKRDKGIPNPNLLTWKDRNPSDYTFHKIDVSQFLKKKKPIEKK